MSTSPIIITPSTSVVLVNTADYAGNPVVLLPNLAGPGVLGRIITVRDNDGGSVNPAKSIYLSTTGGALFQSELSSITLSSFRINQPYGFITLTPRLNDGLGNTSYGLMNVYAFPEASPAAYVNTFNTNFGYISTLSTINLQVNQDTYLKGNLTVNGNITYVNPGATTLDIGRVNTNLISVASVLNSNFYGVNVAASTINTSSFVVRDSGSVLLPNAGSWGNAAAFSGVVDHNSLTLGNPGTSAGAQIGVSSNFFGLRSFSKSGPSFYSTSVVMRDGTVGVNVGGLGDIGDTNGTSNYSMYVRGALQLSNLGINNNIGMLKTTEANSSFVEVVRFGPNSSSNYRIDSSSNIAEGFFGGGTFTNRYNWLTADKNGSVKFWTGNAGTTERLTIDNTGRVGIGTTAPGSTLDVSGELRVTGTSRLGPSVGPTIIGNDNFAYMILGRDREVPGGSYIDFDISASPTPASGLGSRIIRNTGTTGNFNIINYGTGNLQFGTNGINNRMVMDASGRVGINTTSPNYNLDVSGTIMARESIYVGGDAGKDGAQIFMSGGPDDVDYNFTVIESRKYAETEDTELLLFKGNDPDAGFGPDRIRLRAGQICFDTYPSVTSSRTTENIRMVINSNGSVGVGTTTPIANTVFDIVGGSDNNGANGSNIFGIQYRNGGYRHFIKTRHDENAGNGNGIDFYLNNSATAGGSSTAGTGNTLCMSIAGNGVGIGTTSPTTQLTLSNSATNAVSVVNSATRFNVFGSDPTNGAFIGWNNNGSMPLRFATMSDTVGGGFIERMRIDSAGNVGIGCNAPSVKLDVSGNTKITGNLNVTGTITGTLSVVPTGCIMMWSSNVVPTGWLFCNGSAFSSNAYPVLAGVLLDTYGTHSGDNYYLPDMRDRFTVGVGPSHALASTGGNNSINLTSNQMPAHTHTGTTDVSGTHNHTGSVTNSIQWANNGTDNNYPKWSYGTSSVDTTNVGLNITSDGSHSHTFTTASAGGGASIDIRPKYIGINYIIKT